MNRDELFAEGEFQKGSFSFDEGVATVFDDMANRSIPFYREVVHLTASVGMKFVPENGRIYDIGCSTGNTSLHLAKSLQEKKVQIIGIDPSVAMLKKANEKSAVYTYGHEIKFCEGDVENFSFLPCHMMVMNYTLQFISPEKRGEVLKKLCKCLEKGGVLVLSEKLRQEDEQVEKFNTETYEKFKAGNGYSFLEIANKRQALENILVPRSLDANIELLKSAGFTRVEILFKWLNFATFLAIK